MKAVRCHNHEIHVHEVSPQRRRGAGQDCLSEPTVYCGQCERCVRGDYNMCVRGPDAVMGVGRDGGMTEEIIVPEKCLVRLPGGIRTEDACLVEPLSVAVRGIALAGINDKYKVAIVGGGSIGLCAVAIARQAMSAVHLFARHDAQKRAGEILGATLGGESDDYDLVIDCAGTDLAMEQAANLCRPGATMARNPLIAPTLITHRLPLEAAAEAFAIAADLKQGSIKVAFNP